MDNIMNMSYENLKRYLNFRERQVLKNETLIDRAEFNAIMQRLDELRREGYCTALKYAVINSQLHSLRKWNYDNAKQSKEQREFSNGRVIL